MTKVAPIDRRRRAHPRAAARVLLAAVASALCLGLSEARPGAAPAREVDGPSAARLRTLAELTRGKVEMIPPVARLTVELPAALRPVDGPRGETWWTARVQAEPPGPESWGGAGTFIVGSSPAIAFDPSRDVFTDGFTDEGEMAERMRAAGALQAEFVRRDFQGTPILLSEVQYPDGRWTFSAAIYTNVDTAAIFVYYTLPEGASRRDVEAWFAFAGSLSTGRRPAISASDARLELADLYRSLRSAHYDLFARRSKQEYDRRYAETRDQIRGPLSHRELVGLFQRFVAFGRIFHAHLDFPMTEYFNAAVAGEKVLPFDLRRIQGKVLVTRNYSREERLAPGTEILALDGVPIAQAVERAGSYLSGDRRASIDAQLESMFSRWLWLDGGSRESFQVRVARSGASSVEFQVPTVPMDGAESPRQERTRSWLTREVKILEGGVAYLRPGPFMEELGELRMAPVKYLRFVDDAFGQIQQSGATRLLIDLRNNPGGDVSLGDSIVSRFATRPFRFSHRFLTKNSPETRERMRPGPWLRLAEDSLMLKFYREMERRPDGERFLTPHPFVEPRAGARFRGPVLVLINRHCFSSCASLAAMIQDYGFAKIAGEETADLATSYFGVETFTLPRSKIEVTYPKAYAVRTSGDERLRGVVPDVVLPSPLVDDSGEIVLRAALELLRREPPP